MNLNSVAHPELFFIEDFNILLDPENNFLENYLVIPSYAAQADFTTVCGIPAGAKEPKKHIF